MRPAIRAARAEDLTALAALDSLCFGSEAWSTVAWTTEFERLSEDRVILVADVGDVVGYVVLLVPPVSLDVVELLRIAVTPAERRTGIAGQLMTAALSKCAGRTVLLEVAAGNDAAVALYGAFGFEEISRRRGYYAGGEDAVIMRWREEL
ncbi:ribosomal-protein-alanine N-acetyltransferase [Kribbella antiqua]|uniref:Ribosomal-protein-alanine N-acetyltransferase n=1 Tax=Kribbella antiqua TaxID=2512217 RepID=A0A4R2ITX2_9ACTN|nr:GNAT family N-acetyltransferase [Kribbella antiqua]TCO48734.1 ribosomal-protein-alanine N-acetyltransferase [Kribbella antiqua]